jgi:hypothetical protein
MAPGFATKPVASLFFFQFFTEQWVSDMNKRAINPQEHVFSMKWEENGELSSHDTNLLVARIAGAEKSRRGFLSHHLQRRSSQHSIEFT